ncbi:MBL fold metallo-hydrolase [Acidipila sp. EB88]|uniref:MBL fold metallo-hydrolase n=1 Tax=Acidipila sp. EB88 TaxID=2305226 RepID=UPI000F5DD78A|nr:MBL fold metallo-hydrolase [Acidipila sp. EB88]RRA49783.1 MBL fold metallo-hydrolase [Acidipila sp. EB88]
MKPAPDRQFKLNKLRFIAELVRESLFTRTSGKYHRPVSPGPGAIGITWIGHSSFLLEMGGGRVLIDPVFATFLFVLKRRRKPGIRQRDLPPIDLVLLTHAHMDHLNLPSLRGIVRNNRRLGAAAPIVIVPTGVADLVEGLGFREVRVLDTWGATMVRTPHCTVTMTPARHWGARLFNDTWRGYGGYVIASDTHTIYHCGDSAYFPGFAEIGQRLRPDVALLPIGAYSPESFRSVHTSPEDALAAFRDLGSSLFIPMHYGTFRLSREPMDEPPRRLMDAARAAGIADRMLLLEEGITRILDKPETRD